MKRLAVRGLATLGLLSAGLASAEATLTFATPAAPVGAAVQASADGLLPETTYDLVWYSGNAQWVVDGGKFGGIVAPETKKVLQQVRSDAQGKVSFSWNVPEDFGYLHNVKLERGGQEAARQGLTVVPDFSVSPAAGPVGTPIHIKMTGIGYRFWESVWHLLYEGTHTGWLSAISTHGTAEVVIPATGAPGLKVLQVLSGTHPTPYLNQQQAPTYQALVPTVMSRTFTVTAGPAVASAPAQSQILARTPASAPGTTPGKTGPQLTTDYVNGTVGSPLKVTGSGFPAGASVDLTFSTVTGNRISGNGWETQQRPLGQVAADAQGQFSLAVPTPDDLGGLHDITATSGTVSAATTYDIKPSVAEVEPRSVKPGGDITIHLKGVGWTETANIYTLLLDNSFIGYGCAFNSKGDLTIHLKAPGRAGTHFISLFPAIYTGTLSGPGLAAGATPNATYFQLPMLNFRDHPGEVLPAFHLSFTVQE